MELGVQEVVEALKKGVEEEEAFHRLLPSLAVPLVEEVVVGRHRVRSMQSKGCTRRRQWMLLGSRVEEVVLHLLLSQCSMGRWRWKEVVGVGVHPSDDGVAAMVLQRLKEVEGVEHLCRGLHVAAMVGVLGRTVLHWRQRGQPMVEVPIRDLNLFRGRVLCLCLPMEEEHRILFLMKDHSDPKNKRTREHVRKCEKTRQHRGKKVEMFTYR